VGSCCVLIVGCTVIPVLFGVPWRDVLNNTGKTPIGLALDAVFFLLVVGPVEETVFRGYVLRPLLDITRNRHAAVLLSALDSECGTTP